LRAFGYVEGQNLILERRSAEGHFSRYDDIIAELVRLKTDVIVTSAFPMVQQATSASIAVPIVTVFIRDPVEGGLATSLARPGRNITGLTFLASETDGKRIELLKETLPAATRVAYLGTNEDWEGPSGQSVRAVAQAVGLTVIPAAIRPLNTPMHSPCLAGSASMLCWSLLLLTSMKTGGSLSNSRDKRGCRTRTATEKP
jgi:putative tryptophan/tyrosine transport system substrate-binding protein